MWTCESYSLTRMSHMTLRFARERATLSIAELARRTGLTERTIYRLEADETRPLHDTVVALETALQLKAGTLHFGPAAPASREPPLSPIGDRRTGTVPRRVGSRRQTNHEQGKPDRRMGDRR